MILTHGEKRIIKVLKEGGVIHALPGTNIAYIDRTPGQLTNKMEKVYLPYLQEMVSKGLIEKVTDDKGDRRWILKQQDASV